MPETIDLRVRHVTRVEGHGHIVLRRTNGVIEQIEWQVPEAPRFFEAMVRGQSWEDIQTIVSRICGICSVSHSLAALKAIENAMGLEVSPQTDRLRLLTHYMEQIESHVLHAGYLAAPDLLGQPSVVPLAASHPDLVRTVVALHRLGNDGMALLAGRRTHPVTLRPGGFSQVPDAAALREFRGRLQASVAGLGQLTDALADLAERWPAFERTTEYLALVEPGVYTFYHGRIGSTDTPETVDPARFESVVNEYVSPQSTAKWCRWHRESYAVGALARFNLNAAHLKPLAKQTAGRFGLRPGVCNPYFNTLAQVVEVAQVVEHSLELIDALLKTGIRPERKRVRPKAGEGVGAVEAPRGMLFHRYAFDERGRCLKANLCIPTNQNHANIQKDFEALVPRIIERPEPEIRLLLEMLVRAYDPCISCSTHCLTVTFV